VSVITANADGETESMLMLGKDEITMCTKGGGSMGIKGADITFNGGKVIINGTMVNLSSLQVYLGKGAKEPAVRGNKLIIHDSAHIHGTTAPGSPTSPPTGKPLTPGVELSDSVFIS
jgi:hypothetical protein